MNTRESPRKRGENGMEVSNRSAIISLELRNDDCLFAGHLITAIVKIVSRFRLFRVKRWRGK